MHGEGDDWELTGVTEVQAWSKLIEFDQAVAYAEKNFVGEDEEPEDNYYV